MKALALVGAAVLAAGCGGGAKEPETPVSKAKAVSPSQLVPAVRMIRVRGSMVIVYAGVGKIRNLGRR